MFLRNNTSITARALRAFVTKILSSTIYLQRRRNILFVTNGSLQFSQFFRDTRSIVKICGLWMARILTLMLSKCLLLNLLLLRAFKCTRERQSSTRLLCKCLLYDMPHVRSLSFLHKIINKINLTAYETYVWPIETLNLHLIQLELTGFLLFTCFPILLYIM